MIESVLGLIPKGWEVDSMGRSSLGYLAKSGIQAFKGEKIYLATADVSNTNIVNNKTYISMNDKPSRANMQPTANTVWFAKMKDSRKLLLVDEIDEILKNNYIFSTGFAGIQCTETSVYYLWTYIQSESFDTIKNSLATGTTMQSINNRNINNIYIPIPNKKLMNNFNLLVSQLFKYIVKNRQQNLYLSELRDTLLPKLMSGEIRIPFENEEGSI